MTLISTQLKGFIKGFVTEEELMGFRIGATGFNLLAVERAEICGHAEASS